MERVEDAANGMLEKLDRLQAELDRLLSGLEVDRRDARRLARRAEPRRRHAPAPRRRPPAGPARRRPRAPRSDDEAGARLVALNMALEGTPRDEAARFLAEHYALADLDALLDDVYSSAGR